MNISSSILNYFLPPICAHCKVLIESSHSHPFCNSCLENIQLISAPFCSICGDPHSNKELASHSCGDCLKEKPSFETCRSVFELKDPLSSLIYAFKFKASEICLDYFVQEMKLKLSEFEGGFDYLVPVPLHWFRLIRRGYNQALVLAKALSKQASIPLEFHSLKRVGYGQAQKTLNKKERLKNIRNAFQLKAKHPFKDKKVLLIDDVYTTGATLMECSRVLKQAGAEVQGLTLARTLLENTPSWVKRG